MQHFFTELIGYSSAILIFCSFYMKTMSRLRRIAILSNITVLIYAWLTHATPMVVLQLGLLPLNIIRVIEMNRIAHQITQVSETCYDFSPFIPYMKKVHFKPQEIIFQKGERSNQMFLIENGTIILEEINKEIGPNELLGEISLFTAARFRTATAVAATKIDAYTIDYETVKMLHYQNPDFSIYLLNVIVKRLVENNIELKNIPQKTKPDLEAAS